MSIYISQDELDRAFNKVRRELANMGVLRDGSPLDSVDCIPELCFGDDWWKGLIGNYAFYHPFDLPGDGNIHMPTVFPEFIHGKRPVLDTLRHEFGHALADRYKRLFRGGVFKAAFGVSYHTDSAYDECDPSGEYVSDYAFTNVQEDFAETFMFFMKYKGKLPARFRCGRSGVVKKWKAVGEIVGQVRKLTKVTRGK